MPLYDYECQCGMRFETFGGIDDKTSPCPECGQTAARIISASGVFCSNDDSTWVRSVVDVVDKKSKNVYTQEFIKNPTRANLKKHLSANGLRHAEAGEKFGKVGPSFDINRHTERLIQHRREKKAIRLSR